MPKGRSKGFGHYMNKKFFHPGNPENLGNVNLIDFRSLSISTAFLKKENLLLNLTHLPLIEINNRYLIFFIGLGSFASKKILSNFHQIMLM